eukprot:TRINITY_DN11124_c0_g1_i3.p1 TRINITY_DN11124_c0_g1~~TRINITY_DN11124_c0_g1_i3.p1  ORF type:complete len:126 (-),score=0.67 TRINITY_DN11124_c0_g1_i3:2-379(-)
MIFIAVIGFPPIAQTSLKLLAAAIWPKVQGSSTIGVKKSTVWISAVSLLSLQTPASSEVSVPTNKQGSLLRGSLLSTTAGSSGPILAAQPPLVVYSVSFTKLITSCTPLVTTQLQNLCTSPCTLR